jgi:hypothetical protein
MANHCKTLVVLGFALVGVLTTLAENRWTHIGRKSTQGSRLTEHKSEGHLA